MLRFETFLQNLFWIRKMLRLETMANVILDTEDVDVWSICKSYFGYGRCWGLKLLQQLFWIRKMLRFETFAKVILDTEEGFGTFAHAILDTEDVEVWNICKRYSGYGTFANAILDTEDVEVRNICKRCSGYGRCWGLDDVKMTTGWNGPPSKWAMEDVKPWVRSTWQPWMTSKWQLDDVKVIPWRRKNHN